MRQRFVLPLAAARKIRRRAARPAAYNAGQANVDRWIEEGGEIQFLETQQHVDEALELRDVYARAYGDELSLD